MEQNYKNILVVRTDRVGDVVLTTPAIAALRERFLTAKISVLVTPRTRAIMDDNPNLDEVLVDDHARTHRGFFGFWRLVWQIRRRKFDLAVVLHTKKRANLLCFMAGIPHRIGYHNEKFGFLLTQRLKDERAKGLQHEAFYCLDVLKPLGVKRPETLKLVMPVREEAETWAKDFLKEHDILPSELLIAVHTWASCVSKRWPQEKFIELIRLLLSEYSARIFLIGGEDNKNSAATIAALFQNAVIDVTGNTSLNQLASLLKSCRLLIANDSGPVHVAGAVGTPVISIFGRNQAGLSPARWGPLGKKDIVLHKEVGCEICLAHNCMIGFECLEVISPQEVLEAAKNILSGPLSPVRTL